MAGADIPAALAPAFASGFAIQRLFEVAGWPVGMATTKQISPAGKHVTLNLMALLIGIVLSFCVGLHVLQSLGLDEQNLGPLVGHSRLFDGLVTGLIVSGGTEGVNSIMKFLGYAKETTKNSSLASGGTAQSSTG